MMKAEVEVMHFGNGEAPQTKDCGWSLEARKGKKKDPLSEPLEKKAAWTQGDLFWTPLKIVK